MNRDEILTKWDRLKPVQRDAWVAVEIMELVVYYVGNELRCSPHDDKTGITMDVCLPILRYSTDIAAAWQVWLSVTAKEPDRWAIFSAEDGRVSVEYYPENYLGGREEDCGERFESLFPEAICKMALIVSMEAEHEPEVDEFSGEF